MKKKIIYFVCSVLILASCIGCRGYLVYKPQKKISVPLDKITELKKIKIVIDNYHIKNQRYSERLVQQIMLSLNNSFRDVSICASCTQKSDVIYIVPKEFKVGQREIPALIENSKEFRVGFREMTSTIEVVYNADREIFQCTGKIKYILEEHPILEMLLGPFVFLETLLSIPITIVLLPLILDETTGIYKISINNAIFISKIKDIGIDLHNKLLSSTKFQKFANTIKVQQTKPALIEIKPEYTDYNSIIPNNSIDAGESSQINITLTNKGEGTAYNVVLKSNTTDNKVNLQNNIEIGDIYTGESKNAIIPLKADLTLQSGKAAIEIQAKEKRGYDSKKVKLTISKAALKIPNLTIASYKINDSNTGLAKGNGNSIPENGETIELIPLINNTGDGKAVNVDLKIISINNELTIEKETTTIPQILPSKKVTGNLVFSIPRNFNDNKINIDIQTTDVRGVSTAKKTIEIRTETYQPIIAYQYKLIDDNHNGFLENGEEGEIEIQPVNNGK
ncbi:conserved hypothetical protein, secreted, partial [Candidatus Magnetomorum sp. HK-1]